MITNHRHTGIVVNNIENQLKFYKDLLGLDIYYEKIESGTFLNGILNESIIEVLIYKLGKNNKVMIELLHFNGTDSTNNNKLTDYGITHIALTIDDLDWFYQKNKDKINFISQPMISDDKKHKVCFCNDYENNFIELVEEL